MSDCGNCDLRREGARGREAVALAEATRDKRASKSSDQQHQNMHQNTHQMRRINLRGLREWKEGEKRTDCAACLPGSPILRPIGTRLLALRILVNLTLVLGHHQRATSSYIQLAVHLKP